MRLPDWPERLAAVVAWHQSGPFGWGSRDCATLFSDVVQALTGSDPFAAYRPWGSEIDAVRALARSGARTVPEYIQARFDAVAPSEARRGDVGYPPGEADRLACPAVILGAHAMSWRPDGLVMFDRGLVTTAYTIG